MKEISRILIGLSILILGVFIGNFLAIKTKSELKQGQKWFKRIIILNLILGTVGLFINNDTLLFSCFFIAIVTSRGLRKEEK